MINVFQPSFGEAELAAVADVFAASWPGRGPRSQDFEARFAQHLGVEPEQLLLINSCTAGLFLAMELLETGPGDEVVLPSVSFVGAANAVAATGAQPVFCDVDPHGLNPTAEQVARVMTPRTKAVLVLHYGGYPGHIAEIAELCRDRDVRLVEDAACAVASRAGGQACGTFGDIGIWSFDAMKILVTGDGGMLYVRDPELAGRARSMAYHGLVRSSGFSSMGRTGRWWEVELNGFGRRIIGNDLSAALGLVQLERLPDFVARRREIAAHYDALLADAEGIRLPPRLPAGHETSGYFYWVRLEPEIRDQVAATLLERDIYTTFRYPPLHRVPEYGADGPELPGTDEASESTLLLPLHQGLDDEQVRAVARELRAAVAKHTRALAAG